jgi:hypothetical protein
MTRGEGQCAKRCESIPSGVWTYSGRDAVLRVQLEFSIVDARQRTLASTYAMCWSPEGNNLNSHGCSDGTPVPERNPWLKERGISTLKGLNRELSEIQPLQG